MIPILHEEPQFLVVNKPAGLLTQAVPGVDSLQTKLVEQLRVRDQHTGNPFVGVPHRLDRATSGVVLIARNQRVLSRFGAQFQNRLVQKFYLAWVEGRWEGRFDVWRDFLRKIDGQPQAEIVSEGTEGGLLAEMEVRSIVSDHRQSLLAVRIMTGRMHQIRLQLASRGLPIVGDLLYGSRRCFALTSDASRFQLVDAGASCLPSREAPQALHALRLEFRHPKSAVLMGMSAPPPEYWSLADQTISSAVQRLYQLSCQTKQDSMTLQCFQ
jgi:23S rRNA pseudouridine1911/1915/1917 synthase